MNISLRPLFFYVVMLLARPTMALEGDVGFHDPSTVISFGGCYYTYGTGNALPALLSDDGWTWRRTSPLMSVA